MQVGWQLRRGRSSRFAITSVDAMRRCDAMKKMGKKEREELVSNFEEKREGMRRFIEVDYN